MKKIIPTIVTLIAIWIIILASFIIIGYGYLPPDDAMRHSAKVISGKEWSEILVIRDDIKLESYAGWDAILRFIHHLTHMDQHGLVIFSVIFLFLLFSLMPIFFLRYPESWLLSLFIASLLAPGWILRLFLGRPYIFTMAGLLIILFIWQRLKYTKVKIASFVILTVIVSLSVWIHASWYFYLLLIAAFMLAREWRMSVLLTLSSIAGIILGASFTGHPVMFIKQEIMHLFLVFGSHDVERQLVSELRPAVGDFRIIFLMVAMLGWRVSRGLKNSTAIDNPVFILTLLCFILGIVTRRTWVDWGMAALLVWLAMEFDLFLESKIKRFSPRRIILTISLSAALYLSVTTDTDSRWSLTRPMDYISAEDPEQKEWLPSAGGIIYSNDMEVFYQIFYKNPKAPWRYVLGFESAFMRPDDLKILREIQRNFRIYKSYLYFEPWVKKMRPEDRLIIRSGPGGRPNIPELEWHYIALDTWSGRKPGK